MPTWTPLAVIAVFAAYAMCIIGRETVKARRNTRRLCATRAEWAIARAEEIQWQRERRAAEQARQQERHGAEEPQDD